MSYQKWIGRLLFSVIAGWLLLPVQALARHTCTFHDTGIVNLPAQITVPTTTPVGAVIATGEADINFTCQTDFLYFAFAKLARCGDYNSESFNCGGVSIENMENNAVGKSSRDYAIFYSPYMGVGIRMSVRYIESNMVPGRSRPGAHAKEAGVGTKSTFQENRGSSSDRHVAGRGPVSPNAGNAYWKGKLIVELIKIENKWASQKAFDDYSMVSYTEFIQIPPGDGNATVVGKNQYPLGLGYSAWGTSANLTREEFLSHALYLSFLSTSTSDVGSLNPGTSHVYRLGARIVEPIACTVTTPVVNVDMGNVSANDLDKGSTPERTFNVGINCPGGARIAMAFSDNSEPSNTSNTLMISKNSEAAGIGLQLRKDSTPITYNSSNSNMILVAELANAGFVNVPLVAKVVKTGPVRVGRFTAQSTITLGYQ